MGDADFLRLIHNLEQSVWHLVPVGSSIYVARRDMPDFRSRLFSTVEECEAFIHGYVTAHAINPAERGNGRGGE